MELERFEKTFEKLTDFFKEGFYKNPNRFEIDVYGKISDYYLQALIITERLEQDLLEQKTHTKYILDNLKEEKGNDIIENEMQQGILNHVKIDLDLSDFYLYTRQFFDNLTIGIKLSFITVGNKNASRMKHTVSSLLNSSSMQEYKDEIDENFFIGLEQHLKWICAFRDSRDGLVHFQHYLVFTNTKEGDLGYDIMNREKNEWGTNTVKSIASEVQVVINNLSDLMEFLYSNLPKKDV